MEGGEGLFYRKESILCMPSAISIFTPETNAILLTLKFAAPSYKSKQSSDFLPGILTIESRKLQFSFIPKIATLYQIRVAIRKEVIFM